MEKEKAIELIENQLDEIESIFVDYETIVTEANSWKINTEKLIKQIFGNKTHYLDVFNKNFNDLSELLDKLTPVVVYNTNHLTDLEKTMNNLYNSLNMSAPNAVVKEDIGSEESKILQDTVVILARRFGNATHILLSMIEEINNTDDFYITDNPLLKIKNICNRFHLIATQIRARHADRPTIEIEDEYDVQDLLHAVLKLSFDDIRPEEWTPSYAGKSSRMDFLLKKEEIIIEVKKTRKGLSKGEIGDQLLIDIQRYQQHPNCKYLVCFIYDPEGRIPNPNGIENDLSKTENGIKIITIINPKGM